MKNDYGEEDQETNGREANHLGTYLPFLRGL